MTKAANSGLTVRAADVPVILGMVARGDRRHDIAAWFGLNQGRIADVEDGKHGSPAAAPEDTLPPSGSPGPKARGLRIAAARVRQLLKAGDVSKAEEALNDAIAEFDLNE